MKTFTRRIAPLTLATALAFGAAGCGGDDAETEVEDGASEMETEMEEGASEMESEMEEGEDEG